MSKTIDEIKRIRNIRLDELRDVEINKSEFMWAYLEGAITTLTDLMYSYYLDKEENNNVK